VIKYLYIVFFVFSSLTAFAQLDTSVIFQNAYSFKWNNLSDYQKIDTIGQENFHIYDRARRIFPGVTKGEFGTPIRNLSFAIPTTIGFDLGYEDVFAPYKFSLDKIQFYHTPNKSFSRVNYVQATTREDIGAEFDYARNFGDYVNVGLKYSRTQNVGSFENQNSRHTSFGLTTNWRTKKDKYIGYAFFYSNQILQEENGGVASIENDSIRALLSNEDIDRTSIPVLSLSGALDDYENEFGIQQHFTLNKVDTTATKTKHFIGHKITYKFRERQYNDDIANSSLYTPFGLNSSFISTSQETRSLDNELSYNIASHPRKILGRTIYDKNISIGGGFTHNFIEGEEGTLFFNDSTTVSTDGISFRNDLYGVINYEDRTRKLTHKGNGKFLLGTGDDETKTEYLANYAIGYDIDSIGNFELSLSSVNKRPTFLQQRFEVNDQLIWDNEDFDNVISNQLKLKTEFPVLHLTADAGINFTGNYLYLDSTQFFTQADDITSVFQASISHKLKLGHFHLDNQLLYQATDSDFLNLPELTSVHRFYFIDKIFKNRLLASLGADLYNIVGYNAAGYQPLLSSHFSTDQNIKPYPALDVYASFNIQRFKFFFKFENLVNVFDNENVFFTSPNTPARDAFFRFGINWAWFDKEKL